MSGGAARPGGAGGISSAHAPALDLPARFMALGMLALTGVAVSAPWTMPLLLGSFYDPHLLAFVHVNTLGAIGAVIFGATYQLAPVVLQTPLASTATARLSFWCYLGGAVALPVGLFRVWLPALAVGGLLLFLAFGLYIGVVGVTLRRAPRRDVVAWHIAVALVGAAGGATYGPILAINKGTGFLGVDTLDTLAAHATLMLGGWVAVLLAGVAYRLVGMFTLAEDALWIPGAWAELGLTAGGAWLLSTNLHLGGPRPLDLAGAAALLAGFGMFGGQLVRLHRRRRRRGIDVHAPFVLTAAAFGIAATALVTLGLVRDLAPGASLWIIVGWLAIAGMAETAIQGFFYKIATFLAWLYRYAPLAGRQRVPKLEDLYSRRLALIGWALWTTGVTLAAGAVWFAIGWPSRVAGIFVAIGLGCFLANVARIAAAWRASTGRPIGPEAGRRTASSVAAVPALGRDAKTVIATAFRRMACGLVLEIRSSARKGDCEMSSDERTNDAITLDVREVSPRERHARIFEGFERLRPGQAMRLVNDHDPKPLYYQFMAERPGEVGWEYLEEGPDVWQVRIARLAR